MERRRRGLSNAKGGIGFRRMSCHPGRNFATPTWRVTTVNVEAKFLQRVAIVPLITESWVGPLEPCTVFTVTENGRALVGGNEDREDLPVRAWFLVPGAATHGMVLFGFINGWSQAGMNVQGLCFDRVAGDETGRHRCRPYPQRTFPWSGGACPAFEYEFLQEARLGTWPLSVKFRRHPPSQSFSFELQKR